MANSSFSLGVTYWPRRTAFRGWVAFDRGAAHEELAHIASLGCDTVRLCLRWEDFQPRPMRIGSAAMRALEQTLDAAQAAGLRVAAVLFAGAMGGSLQLPAWTTGVSPFADDLMLATRIGPLLAPADPRPPVVYDDRSHDVTVRDLFRDAAQIESQRYLIDEIVGYFGSHPSVWAWQIGYELERALPARSSEEAYDWLADLGELARSRGARRLLGVVSPRSLHSRDTLRPEGAAELTDQVAVDTYPHEPLRLSEPYKTTGALFLHALTAALAGKSVLVANLGLATSPDNRARIIGDRAFGRVVRTYLADEDQQAAYLEDALMRLYRVGASGAWWANYADAPSELWRIAPYEHFQRERTLGLVRADGREKPAAHALRHFAERMRGGDLGDPGGTPSRLDIDPEIYWRNPATEMQLLLREWAQGQIEE